MSAEKDQLVISLQEKVKEKKTKLKKIRPEYITTCLFKYQGMAVNIHTVSNIDQLMYMLAFLIQQRDNFLKATNMTQLNTLPEFKYDGFTFEDWFQDIQTRVYMIEYTVTKNELDQVEKRLANLESDELKADRELSLLIELLK